PGFTPSGRRNCSGKRLMPRSGTSAQGHPSLLRHTTGTYQERLITPLIVNRRGTQSHELGCAPTRKRCGNITFTRKPNSSAAAIWKPGECDIAAALPRRCATKLV